uniref:Rho GTPase-activating protein 12-like n=1 Tax=Sinocyclocheilus grahami TaxID=75366 RepID=A0A672R363_SINGR
MTERDGRCDFSIAPGQVYIEVEYDYEYKAKDRLISIRQGECYMLVRKTNEDWWQVRREEGTKAFYVPAQYVREVRRALMPPPKPRAKPPNVLEIGQCRSSNENLNQRAPTERSSFGRPSPSTTPSPLPGQQTSPLLLRDTNQNSGMKSVVAELTLLNNNNHHNYHHGNPTLPEGRAESPPREHGCQGKLPGGLSVDTDGSVSPADGLEKMRNDSESGDELSSSSTEHIQVRMNSMIYAKLQLKVLPPDPEIIEPIFKNSGWIKHVDEQGRPYYYSADGSRSEWELPKYNLSPQISGEAPKSHSLERKQQEPIVLTKWRHSTYVLDVKLMYCAALKNVSMGHLKAFLFPFLVSHLIFKIVTQMHLLFLLSCRKNWASTWTVLQGSSLLFAKGQGSGTSWFGGNQSKPEFMVDLRGGSVEWASKEKSSKKHVIELKTRVGTELLIQSEIDTVINDWFRALSETINTHAWESDEAIEEDMPESPGTEKHDREKDPRDSKKNRVKNSSLDSSEQKTRVKLKKFLTRRPTLQAVRDKGYIKDQVFGCSLTALCQRESTSVPNFVKMCIEHVENTSLNVDGLYRVSGNLAVIQKLRFAVNHDEKVNLEDNKWEDIHVTTGALKMFFRELPEPLFTYASFNDFVEAIKHSDYKQRVQSIKDLIKQLPKPNQETMKVLFKHLKRVIDHGEVNRMTTQSVAIVFGPTLLRPEIETGNMAVHMVYQNQIVELILLEYENIFGR